MATTPGSIASLTISFGLVAIPVKLHSATVSSERISFNLLRAKDGIACQTAIHCRKRRKLVERSEMTKGYEFAKDQYVIFSPQELEELEDATSQSIDIGQFVPLESVDPVYFGGTYYLAPDKGGAKPYSLLSAAPKKSKQCAVEENEPHQPLFPIIMVLQRLGIETRERPLDQRLRSRAESFRLCERSAVAQMRARRSRFACPVGSERFQLSKPLGQ